MEEQFDFGDISYEYISHESYMPFKTFFISVGYRGAHWHREFEIILILKGEISITVGNEIQKLEKGDLYLLNPYEIHGFIKGSESNLLLVLQVDPVISSACPINLHCYNFQLSPRNKTDQDVQNKIKILMAGVMKEVIYKKSGYEYQCMGAVNSLVALLIRHLSSVRDSGVDLNQKIKVLERLNTILNFVNENYDREIPLQELAELVGLSTYYVSHMIKETTGLSFRENLSIIRTHRAINLMLTTDKKLVDIACDAGFSDLKYFNKSFKKIYGETPSKIRKRSNWQEIIGKDCSNRYEADTELISFLDNITAL